MTSKAESFKSDIAKPFFAPMTWLRDAFAWPASKWYAALCTEIFILIALGGGVRAMDAGLACPDWPLCFGDYIPDYHPQDFLEFIHRALAGLVGIVSTIFEYPYMAK